MLGRGPITKQQTGRNNELSVLIGIAALMEWSKQWAGPIPKTGTTLVVEARDNDEYAYKDVAFTQASTSKGLKWSHILET